MKIKKIGSLLICSMIVLAACATGCGKKAATGEISKSEISNESSYVDGASSQETSMTTDSSSAEQSSAASTQSVTSVVSQASAPSQTQQSPSSPTITGENLSLNYNDAKANLLSGITAKDSAGKTLTVKVTDNGGFKISALGNYTVKYEAVDAKQQKTTFSRTVSVTYFGLSKEDLSSKAVSLFTKWSFRDAATTIGRIKFVKDWNKYVVPSGHSADWNMFEDGGFCINMRGSDTEGRNKASKEVEDDLPNTFLWNHVAVPKTGTSFKIFASAPLYADYNNMVSRFRVTAITTKDFKVITLQNWTETKSIDVNNCFTVDTTKIAGQDVILFIEQDSAKEVFQDFTPIKETRDAFFVYEMQF